MDTLIAYDYYERCQPDLGERFLEAVLARYDDLIAHPQYYGYINEDPLQVLRDVKLNSFPFVVVFEIREEEVVVYAVHNTYRDPANKLL